MGARTGAGRVAGGGGAAASQAGICTGKPRLKAWGQGTRGAHGEHGFHGRDLGGVKAERLVECRRGLPSRKEGVRAMGGEVRAGRREGVWGGGGASGHMYGEGPAQGLGARARAERTSNMPYMSVTLDVSQLSGWLNADAPCRVERRGVRCGARCGPGGGRAWRGAAAAQAACTEKGRLKA